MGFKKLEKELKNIDRALKQSIHWLEKSGIQNSLNKKNLLSGSVNAWYDPQKKKYSFVYSEINGYFMTMMVFLYKRTGEKKYLNKGIIKNIKISRFNKFINRSSSYLPFLREAKYIGSMYVVRTIKKNKEKTDERTSSVNFHSNKILGVLSGKWNNCVYLAKNLSLIK